MIFVNREGIDSRATKTKIGVEKYRFDEARWRQLESLINSPFLRVRYVDYKSFPFIVW